MKVIIILGIIWFVLSILSLIILTLNDRLCGWREEVVYKDSNFGEYLFYSILGFWVIIPVSLLILLYRVIKKFVILITELIVSTKETDKK